MARCFFTQSIFSPETQKKPWSSGHALSTAKVFLLSLEASGQSRGARNLLDCKDMHMHAGACIYECMNVCVSLCECVDMHACVYMHAYLCISAYMCICIFVCMLHACMCVCIHRYMLHAEKTCVAVASSHSQAFTCVQEIIEAMRIPKSEKGLGGDRHVQSSSRHYPRPVQEGLEDSSDDLMSFLPSQTMLSPSP